jgi:predicted helicase
MSFNAILDKYRKDSFSERDKGERFERLMQAFLQTDPKYAHRFQNVWLWDAFPAKNDLGGSDTGIDLVAKTFEGDYWAIQCKCYLETTVMDKPKVDSFLATSSRTFQNDEGKTVRFAQRLWIATSNKWGLNAFEAIQNQNPPVIRLNLADLQQSPVDWALLEKGIHGEKARNPKKQLRPHQLEALQKTNLHFQNNDRGKLIMACGTGKTLNALRIAENETNGNGFILFLVPSIALLGQTLREWSADAFEPIQAICICSDPEISRKKSKQEDSDHFSVVDLALPASTNPNAVLQQLTHFKAQNAKGLTVVFSTYQSIEVVAKAQTELLNHGFNPFDLIICDEAHRTTGVSLVGEDESIFTKVHDNQFIRAKKRLYMTATPRLYSDDSKSKAAQNDAILCSMDDDKLYGAEIYRIGFGEAVERDLLTDYKVLILTLNDKDVPPIIQKMIADKNQEINSDDAAKLIGCINALSKQILGDAGILKDSDPEPMRRAVAFCPTIKVSEKIAATYNATTDTYLNALNREQQQKMVAVAAKHIDGTMSAPQRDDLLTWLKAETDANECRMLTNVRCLSEGVDVPSLDAVLFLSARNSQVDVVQSVGRVMRKAPNKKYGYIIIPVVVPADVPADKALDDNDRYKVVWTVLNALRAHDDRFNATVNKLELNRNRPSQILVGRPAAAFDDDGMPSFAEEDSVAYGKVKDVTEQLSLEFEQLQQVMFARMVQKVGDRRYWEQWAKNVADIAERQIQRINRLITNDLNHQTTFQQFLTGLQKNINPSIQQQAAVEMLSQHIITKPVFEALFEGYSFVRNNPISVAMQAMLDLLEDQAFDKDADTLHKFYESVKMRASGIDNAEGKQRIIIELYDKFFKTAFPRMVEQLGIVYTPVEVVDFMIHSVNDVLKKEFGRTISDENIQILDPFTGTGTFITRLLQSGLIETKDLKRKYLKEIHANEMVLLAYYIAAVNIENAFHDALPMTDYLPFEGICLTDTFQLGEKPFADSELQFKDMFPQNTERVDNQKLTPLRVIIGNPPYSVGQKSANDNAQNQSYPKLDARIAKTFAAQTDATNKNSLYDSYIKAFRWSADRLDPQNGGIVCFVSNGAWLDGNSADGLRKCFEQEFTSIYVFNLKGNARTSGELRQKEAGNVFGSGSRTPIAITLLIKNPTVKVEKATIHYYDIGDYLNREEKLRILQKFQSIDNQLIAWQMVQPNEQGDWISQRSNVFETFIPLGDKDDKTNKNTFFVPFYSNGVQTNRDAWVYNFSSEKLRTNLKQMIQCYNESLDTYETNLKHNPNAKIEYCVESDEAKIKWSSSLLQLCVNKVRLNYVVSDMVTSMYRPFVRENLYFNRHLNHRPYLMPKIFPTSQKSNLLICVSGVGVTKDFSAIMTNMLPDLELIGKSQCFPLYYYEEQVKQNPKQQSFQFDDEPETAPTTELQRRDGISDFILTRAKKQYGKLVTKEDLFYYVYGFLHSPAYKTLFSNDLKKMLPRLPLLERAQDFWAFSKAGRALAALHLDYENVPIYIGVQVTGAEQGNYAVEKMRFPKKDQKETIHYNSQIVVSNIPEKAYQYVVNGKSAIEWVMERYQITTHKESGIQNDPNDWAKAVGKPRYILDLLLSVINVSVQTVEIVANLPEVRFEV